MLKVKIFLLASMLALVLYGIYALNTGRVDLSAFEDKSILNLCPTRIVEIVETNTITTYRIHQERLKWSITKANSPAKEIPVPKMEKWLGEHCSIKIDHIATEAPPDREELGEIKLRLLNGQALILKRYKNGFHSLVENQWFKSNEWDVALAKLATMDQ